MKLPGILIPVLGDSALSFATSICEQLLLIDSLERKLCLLHAAASQLLDLTAD